jgi:transposase-like protein
MSDFKGLHFEGKIVLWAVRWYCKYGVSYREAAEMLEERGVAVDHTTIHRWVQRYAPEIEKRLRWYWRRPAWRSWRVDETHVKVRGRWAYLYRAVDKRGATIELYLSLTRNAKAAKRFLGKALRALKRHERPEVINTDKAGCYGPAIAALKKEGRLTKDVRHRQVRYLNNILEADHGKLKRLIKPARGFQSIRTAYATVKGFEGEGRHATGPSAAPNRALKKGQCPVPVPARRRGRSAPRAPQLRALLSELQMPAGTNPSMSRICNGARTVALHRIGRFRDRGLERQQTRAAALNLVTAAIILFNCRYLGRAIAELRRRGDQIDDALVAQLSPLGWDRINLTGDYVWSDAITLDDDGLMPLALGGRG